jgi:GTPase SAR1 family protein
MNNNPQAAINEAIFKLIVIGDSGAGKSSLLNRYIKDQFKPNH